MSHAITHLLRALLLTPSGWLDGVPRWGLTALIWGPPGAAKTATWCALAAELGLPYEWLSPGHRGEGAFGVVPVPEGKALTYPAPDWCTPLAGGGLVLVDELTCAPPAIQPALLGLLHDRRVGSAQLPGACRVVAAANPVDSAANGYDLPAAEANRCIHLEWRLEPAAWLAWARSPAGLDAKPADSPAALAAAAARRLEAEASILARWPAAFGRATALATGYLSARPHHLLIEPPAGSPEASRAWPSPRSWCYARRCLAAVEIHNLTEIDRDTLLAGCLGEGVSLELCSWLRDADLPDVERVLDGTIPWTTNPSRPDRDYAVLAGCADALPRRSGKAKIAAAKVVLAILAATPAPDLVRLGAEPIYGDPELQRALSADPTYRTVSRQFHMGDVETRRLAGVDA